MEAQWFENRRNDSDTVWYRVGSHDEIREASETWDAFALANGAPHLVLSQVVGQSLWSFIAGAEVRHLYELLLARIRESQKTVVLPFRCDAPDRRRFMEMAVVGLAGGEVEFVTRVVREEGRDPVSLETGAVESQNHLLAICSWCKRVRLTEAQWVELEQAIERLALFNRETLPPVTHGLCEDCYTAVIRALPATQGTPA